ncbi:FtsX-like permease family protein [Spirillospora sp. NBC_01491]|uniref:FtsX-like permease family protein n=1 Tax=Spirillospora sp. NBC_01491 TaxID=2976007 RepID=UPI002E36134F|nr:FtsX-like permease family protein [Spirillospora sp. NBC_01491]
MSRVSRGSAHRAAVRIARRDAMRSKGRTALVLCMIGLPVLAVVALAVLAQTAAWSPKEELPYELGTADARFYAFGREPVDQTPGLEELQARPAPAGDADAPWTSGEVGRTLAAKYGPGVRIVPVSTGTRGVLRTAHGYVRADLKELDLRDPLARGMFEVTAGRAPASADEVALAPSLRGKGFTLGSMAQVGREGTPKRVVGYVIDPRRPDAAITLGLPGAFPGRSPEPPQWLVSAGRPVTWADVKEFNKAGLSVLSRDAVEHPPPASEVDQDLVRSGDTGGREVMALAVAMIVLEVVLLTGPAFAVGVRHRRRQLALIAAAGGDRRHLRAVVLAGGLVLGSAAALAGAGLGIGAAALARQCVHMAGGERMGPFEVPWALAAATMALGVGSGLVAAYLPARQAARAEVVAALAGRRDGGRVRLGRPLAGAVLIVAGVVLSLVGVRFWRELGAAFGATAITIGCVLVAPWLVAAAGRAARFLPLPLRLAVRDGSRNRARSAPVVAAIMAAVAGITALAIGGASDFQQERREYERRLPPGSALLRAPADRAAEAGRAVRRELPGVPLVELRTLPGEESGCESGRPQECPGVAFTAEHGPGEITIDNVVAGAKEARFLLGRDDPAVTAALAAGKVVFFGAKPPQDAVTTARVSVWEANGGRQRTLKTVPGLPAVTLPGDPHARVLVPPEVARRIGVPPRTEAFGVDRAEHRVTGAEEARLKEVLLDYGKDGGGVYVERGFTGSFGRTTLLLGVVGAVLALGGSLIATGLSAADARPDLATLAAVGAHPRTRRLLMMGQAWFVALLGCWLGLAAGLVPGIAVARTLTLVEPVHGAGGMLEAAGHGPILDIPWTLLGVIAIVIPLVAMLAAGLFTRSRLPMARRVTA